MSYLVPEDKIEINSRELNTREQIVAGFPNSRTLNLHQTVSQTLKRDKTGNIVCHGREDFSTRMGISKDPIAIRDLWTFSVTHKILHGMQFFMNILMRIGKHLYIFIG